MFPVPFPCIMGISRLELGYCDVEWLAMEKNWDNAVVFEIAVKHCMLDFFFFFFYYEGYSISSKGLLPTVVDIMVIWIKFSHSSSFQFVDS